MVLDWLGSVRETDYNRRSKPAAGYQSELPVSPQPTVEWLETMHHVRRCRVAHRLATGNRFELSLRASREPCVVGAAAIVGR